MRYLQLEDAREFCAAAKPLLLANEAENNLLIGIASRLSEQAAPDSPQCPSLPLLCAVEDAGRIVAAAAMTPPHRLITTRVSREAAEVLIRELHARQIGLPGAIGPGDAPSQLARVWSDLTAQHATLIRRLRVYQLDQVIPPPPASGRFQAACSPDSDLLIRWNTQFWNEVNEPAHALAQSMRRHILQRQVFLWLDPLPVSMAAFTGPTPNGIRISLVYSPPEHRRHGYATALTAALSQYLLNSGYRFCFCFTDLANPISNSIYPKVGYRPVCDYEEFDFPRPAWPKVPTPAAA